MWQTCVLVWAQLALPPFTYVHLQFGELLFLFPIQMLTFVSVTTEVWAINKRRIC